MVIRRRLGLSGVFAAVILGAAVMGQVGGPMNGPARMSGPVALTASISPQPSTLRVPTCQQDPYQPGCGLSLRTPTRRG